MKILGVAGTAKNTGKTTTTMALIDRAVEENSPPAITSIGLDGEELDQVTLLPKPRLALPRDSFLITAEQCLEGGTARLEVLQTLQGKTPLGRLLLTRVKEEGRVLMAGPGNGRDLKEGARALEQYGVPLLLVDGALNRMAPLAGADLFVLATGAARQSHLPTLRRETEIMVKALQLPRLQPRGKTLSSYELLSGGSERGLEMDSLLSPAAVHRVFKNGSARRNELYIRGVLTGEAFLELAGAISPGGCRLIVKSPIHLLLGESLPTLARALDLWRDRGGEIGVESGLDLRAITVNPFFPDYQERGRYYHPRYVDAHQLQSALQSLGVPVVDVVREGGHQLWAQLFSG